MKMVQKSAILFLVIGVAVWSTSGQPVCPSEDDPNNPILYEDPQDCGAFLECAQGRLVKFACNSGLYYNDAMKYCDYPANVNCGTRPVPGGPAPDPAPEPVPDPVPEPIPDPVPSNKCPAVDDPKNDVLFEDPADCTSFYKCFQGTPYKIPCNLGLCYDDAKKWCDYPENVNCGARPIPSGPVQPDPVPDPAPEPVPDPVPVQPNTCPAVDDPKNDVLFEDPADCTDFYKCYQGTPYLIPCNPGLCYDNAKKWCDYPENVNCGTRPSPYGPVQPDPVPDPAPEPVPDPVPVQPNTCPAENDPNNDVLFEDPSDCTSFYKCDRGTPYKIPCNPGLCYDDANKWCDYPEKVNCGTRPSPFGPVQPDPVPDPAPEPVPDPVPVQPNTCPAVDDPKNDVLFEDAADCTSFYKCFRGTPYKIPCNAGLCYDDAKKWCDYPENVNCGTRPIPSGPVQPDPVPDPAPEPVPDPAPVQPTTCPATDDGGIVFFADPADCTAYYECDHGAPVKFPCGSGLYYNDVAKQCDYPANVACGSRPVPS